MVARTVCAEVHRHVHQKPTLETRRRGKQEASPAQGGDTSMKHRMTAGALPARRVHRKVKGARTGAVICPHSGVSFTKDGESELGSHPRSPREKSLFPASTPRELLTLPASISPSLLFYHQCLAWPSPCTAGERLKGKDVGRFPRLAPNCPLKQSTREST